MESLQSPFSTYPLGKDRMVLQLVHSGRQDKYSCLLQLLRRPFGSGLGTCNSPFVAAGHLQTCNPRHKTNLHSNNGHRCNHRGHCSR